VLNVAKVKPGRSVAILGAGHLGLWMVQGARLAGAGRIIAVEPIAERRQMAGRLGATDLVDPADGDPIEQVKELTGGRGADYVLEAAGPTAAQEQALPTARRAGTVVLTGVERLGATVTFSQFELALQGRRVLSCQNGNVRMRRDLPLFVGMLEDGRLDAGPIITSRYALDDINEALAASAEKRDLTGVIVPNGRG
jgi:S-(hydroxymethyl)glutathione dehydrogenase / alcohol dehydrogenase